jgi:Helix-turn-helix domain
MKVKQGGKEKRLRAQDWQVHSEAHPKLREPKPGQEYTHLRLSVPMEKPSMAAITRIQPRPYSFRVDNIIIDEYGEKIGAIGVAIYNVLARHADRVTGICYPSIRLIAKKLALGRTTVKKYLRILLNYSELVASFPSRRSFSH